MRIGLIGINRYAKFLNFACNLHVYAFQEFLRERGFETKILDYRPAYFNDFNMRNPAPYAEAKYRDAVRRKAKPEVLTKWAELAIDYRSITAERERRYDKFEAFIDEHLDFTDDVYDSDLLEIEDPGFDCYICVTDVIWQSIATHVFDRGFLLGSKAFEGKAKISYAASRGASADFTERQAEIFFGYLRDIDAISVRERDFSEYIEAHSDLSAQTVLDPVMLHGREFWQRVSVKPSEERYVLLYYVMEGSADTIAKAAEYAKYHDLTLVELSDRPLKHGRVTDPDVKHIARYDVGADEWLGYIEHADAVFTNSFHGCCFALLFEKPLFVGKRNGQKVPNFLATFGLSDRQFSATDDVADFADDVDYSKARELLAIEREKSVEFVSNALADATKKMSDTGAFDHSPYDAVRQQISYPVRLHSGGLGPEFTLADAAATNVRSKRLPSGALECTRPDSNYTNNGSATIESNPFAATGREFIGWTMRFRIDNRWFWYLDDGSIAAGDAAGSGLEARMARFTEGQPVPHLPVNRITVAVFVAQWRTQPSVAESSAPPGSLRPDSSPRALLSRVRRRLARWRSGRGAA